jgi:DNA polymerase III subunit delta
VSPDAPPVLLIWGDSPFLLRLAALEAFGPIRPTEVEGRDWHPGATGDLATPSLFGEARGLLVTGAQNLPDEALPEMARFVENPAPGTCLVLTFEVGTRAKGPPRSVLKGLGEGIEVRRVVVERRELPAWVRHRAGHRGLPVTAAGATALVQTLGEDPALLDQALVQIADAHPQDGLTPETVAAQFRGFGDRYMWELSDAAFGGNLPGAARVLAGLLQAGQEPLAILGALAARLRDLIRVAATGPRTPPAEVARAVGLRFDWQARRYRDQARRYPPGALESIHQRLVEADRSIKQGSPGDVVLTQVVTGIAGQPAAGEGASGRMRRPASLRGA